MFRGISFKSSTDSEVNKLSTLNIGDTFDLRGMTSTSRSVLTSLGFATKKGAMFQIKMPNGTHAIITNSGEAEIILPHEAKLKILSTNKVDNMLYPGEKMIMYEAELIDDGRGGIKSLAFAQELAILPTMATKGKDSAAERFSDNFIGKVTKAKPKPKPIAKPSN